jgi:U6 snRNA-associated Sm-like protein LSm8
MGRAPFSKNFSADIVEVKERRRVISWRAWTGLSWLGPVMLWSILPAVRSSATRAGPPTPPLPPFLSGLALRRCGLSMSSLQGYVDRESPSISSLLRIQTTFASGRVLLVLQDGRSIVVRALPPVCPPAHSTTFFKGVLSGYDQKSNIVLSDSKERVYSMDEGVEEIPLGLYLVKGDMMCVRCPFSHARVLHALLTVHLHQHPHWRDRRRTRQLDRPFYHPRRSDPSHSLLGTSNCRRRAPFSPQPHIRFYIYLFITYTKHALMPRHPHMVLARVCCRS